MGNVFKSLRGRIGLRSVTVYGGVGFNPQVEKLKRGAEIVVACPGRPLDHIGKGTIDLSKVEMLALDEANHMFDYDVSAPQRDKEFDCPLQQPGLSGKFYGAKKVIRQKTVRVSRLKWINQ